MQIDKNGWVAADRSLDQKSQSPISNSTKNARQEKNDDNNNSDDDGYRATQTYIDTCANLFNRAMETVTPLRAHLLYSGIADEIVYFIEQGNKQIDQIFRRCFKGETIPHNEKVFSIFEPHTEWIVKGKAGISQELGVRVCVVESSDRFILHYMIMENKTDDQIAVQIIKETKKRFSTLKSCSYDKGFHSPQNQEELRKELEFVVLPKKGRRNSDEQAHEGSERFGELRRKHSAVESAINALEHTGLDMCRDCGIEGFKRYVALSIVARNIHRLGCILQEKELEEERRNRKKAA
jgi:hypothetical protein